MTHPVTQLVCSMLGLVVFPHENCEQNRGDEQQFAKSIEETFTESPLNKLEQNGWPHWVFTLDEPPKKLKDKSQYQKTATLKQLVKHLRNAVSHYRIGFSSDSSDLSQVNITFEDKPNDKNESINWRTEVCALDLLTFCNKLAEFVLKVTEDQLG
jgi:HEPN pEK499 p136